MQEAYSHEVSSCGFWPGNGGSGEARLLQLCLSRAAGFPPRLPSCRNGRSTIGSSDSSCCPTTRSDRRLERPISYSSSFSRAPTRLRPSSGIGTAPSWSGRETSDHSGCGADRRAQVRAQVAAPFACGPRWKNVKKHAILRHFRANTRLFAAVFVRFQAPFTEYNLPVVLPRRRSSAAGSASKKCVIPMR